MAFTPVLKDASTHNRMMADASINDPAFISESTMPLLDSSPAEHHKNVSVFRKLDRGTGSELRYTAKCWYQIPLAFLLILAPHLILPVVMVNGLDPLGLSLVAYFSALASFMIGALMVATQERRIRLASRLKTQGEVALVVCMQMTTMIWGSWLVFLVISWFWARYLSTAGLGPGTSIIEVQEILAGFQNKIDTPDAFFKLTACLKGILPQNRNATIADFNICLENMGMKDGTVLGS